VGSEVSNSGNNSSITKDSGSNQTVNSNYAKDASSEKSSSLAQEGLASYITEKLRPNNINSDRSDISSSPAIKIFASYYALQVLVVLIKYTFF
jgi:hypothetical protein